LDLGSGEGWSVGELLRLGIDAIGVDVSHVSVKRANNRFPNRFSVASILNLPFMNEEFETVVTINCLEHLAAEDVPRELAEIHRGVRRFALLQIATTLDQENGRYLTVEGRQWWEDHFFQAGFRKAPGYYNVNRYKNLNDDRQIYLELEKVPSDAQRRTPHPPKDMSRRSGLDSDRTLFPRCAASYGVLCEAYGLSAASFRDLAVQLMFKFLVFPDKEVARLFSASRTFPIFDSDENSSIRRHGLDGGR